MTLPLRKILILAANPKQTVHLRLNEELRDIKEGLQRSLQRDKFELRYDLAVRPRDIRRSILDFRPNIIHFSGHGAGMQGLYFENETGHEQLVTGEALAGLFSQFSKQVELVLLNACYSEVQAEAIVQHINYAIGMNDSIEDKAAIEFVVGFYDALAAYNPQYDEGAPVEFAFNIARNAIELAGVSGQSIPKLKKKLNFNPRLCPQPVVLDEGITLAEETEIYNLFLTRDLAVLNKNTEDFLSTQLNMQEIESSYSKGYISCSKMSTTVKSIKFEKLNQRLYKRTCLPQINWEYDVGYVVEVEEEYESNSKVTRGLLSYSLKKTDQGFKIVNIDWK